MRNFFTHQHVKLTVNQGTIPAGTRGEIIRDKQNGTYLVNFDFKPYPATECSEEVLEVYRPKNFSGVIGRY